MDNIYYYFNTFLRVIFGQFQGRPLLQLLDMGAFNSYVTYVFSDYDLVSVLCRILESPSFIFSCFVWFWFAWLSLHLLLIWPFNWIRSVIRKCRG